MRMRRETWIGEFDAPAIEKLAAGRDGDEHRGVTVLGDADGRSSRRSSSHYALRGNRAAVSRSRNGSL